MTEKVVDIKTQKEYVVDANKANENAQVCPVCSEQRKNRKAKVFSYNATQGIGYCQHCGVKVVKKKELEKSNTAQYTRPKWENHTELPDKVVEWFKTRGIGQNSLLDCRVTYGKEFMPQVSQEMGVIQFNYFRDGELVNVKYRDGQKNFKLVKGAELIFYGLDDIKDKDECVIVEGEIDKLSYYEVGIKNVVSVPNGAAKGSLKLEYLDNCWELFEGMKKIYLATDDDQAGRILQEELARRFGKERCYKVTFFGHKDANELLQADRLHLEDTIQQAVEFPIEGVYTARDLEKAIWDLKRNGMRQAQTIGIPAFDKQISFEEGYVTLVTGIPGHGKSEFTDQIVTALNRKAGWKAAYFSPENWPLHYHHSKIATKLTGGSFTTESDKCTELAIDYCEKNFFMIYPEEDFSLDSILEKARMLVKKVGIKSLIIDAWNKLEHLHVGNESQYISKELDKLDTFAKRNGIHVFLVAHPTKMRKEDDGINYVVPDGYSVSGSAAFFSKPANVICVYRRYFDVGRSTVEVYIQKVKFRHWGEGRGTVGLKFDQENGRYYEDKPDKANYLLGQQAELDLEPKYFDDDVQTQNTQPNYEPAPF